MKRLIASFIAVALLLAGCSSGEKKSESGNTKLDDLTVYFVPSRDSAEILEATEPLKNLLKDEMKNQGYDIGEVVIEVGSTYEAVGEALTAGTADIGLIPGGTYVIYAEDGIDVALTATRDALSVDAEDPKEWNENEPIKGITEQATYYRSLIIAGPSAKGKKLQEVIESGKELTWDMLKDATWAVRSSSSSAGYIYPTIWLDENYGKSLTDIPNTVITDGYGASFNALAAETADITVVYADARRDYEEQWNSSKEGGMSRSEDIWAETAVLGVTPGIYNDTISVSTETVDEDLKKAIQEAFINIAETEEGKEIISIYSHNGYQVAKDSDYDNERKAQEILKELD
ncbi:MAG: phosphate/phosphite/phosphonate ABC transporter substrate-binding protein [Lactovum sp.]